MPELRCSSVNESCTVYPHWCYNHHHPPSGVVSQTIRLPLDLDTCWSWRKQLSYNHFHFIWAIKAIQIQHGKYHLQRLSGWCPCLTFHHLIKYHLCSLHTFQSSPQMSELQEEWYEDGGWGRGGLWPSIRDRAGTGVGAGGDGGGGGEEKGEMVV